MPGSEESSGRSGGKKPFRRRGRIAFALTAVFCAVGLVPLGTVAWKLIQINRDALTLAQQEKQLLLAASTAREVDIHLDGLKSRVRTAASNLSTLMEGRRSISTAGTRRILTEAEGGAILYVRFTDLRGHLIGSKPETSFPPGLRSLFTSGVRGVAEHLAGGDSVNHTVWVSKPYLLDVDGPAPAAMVLLASPVVSRGKFRGVMAALVDFKQIWNGAVRSRSTGQTVFILDAGGLPFASSDPLDVMPGQSMAEYELVKRYVLGARRTRETTPFQREVDGKVEHFIGSYEISRQGWGVFVQAKMEQVYLPVRTMIENTTSWALGALGLAILAALVFARTVSKPINRLAEVSRAFAAGDFHSRAEIRSKNEIGELSDTFNFMAEEIESQISKLKSAAQENNKLFLSTIRVMANAIDAKDPYTKGHSVRVNRYSVIIARYMGLPKQEIDAIHVASVLHDVGKIGIQEAILNKPGALTPEEYEIMKTHTTRGAEIMAPIRKLKHVIDGLRSHHERWNGSGYPDGLAGERIPLMGRVIAVADTFDAMTTDRPYQRPFSFEQAVARINELKGVGFDEQVVEAFNRAYMAGEFESGSKEEEQDALAIA